MRAQIVAELATAHGGDVQLAADMIRAACDAGASLAKLQTYQLQRINPRDPQADWLHKAWLSREAHEHLIRVGQDCGIEVFSTPFDADSLQMLRGLGLTRFKVASSESGNGWWQRDLGVPYNTWIVSYPWGCIPDSAGYGPPGILTNLTAIPLYPTPLECVGQATLLDGWSDHTEGISACVWALAQGATMIEAHICLPGRSREKPWDKTPQQMRQLREYAEQFATMRTGVSETFRTRWSR